MSNLQKNTELADKLVKKGDKCIKIPGWKIWKSKDYVSALINYEKAIPLYKISKNYKKLVILYDILIDINFEINDNWMVCKNYKEKLDCLVNLKKFNLIIECLEKMITFYVMEDSIMHLKPVINNLINNNVIENNLKKEIWEVTLDKIQDAETVYNIREELLHENLIIILETELESNIEYIKNLLIKEIEYLKTIDIDTDSNISYYCMTILFIDLCNNNDDDFKNNFKKYKTIHSFYTSNLYEFILDLRSLKGAKELTDSEKSKLFSAHCLNKLVPNSLIRLKNNFKPSSNFSNIKNNHGDPEIINLNNIDDNISQENYDDPF